MRCINVIGIIKLIYATQQLLMKYCPHNNLLQTGNTPTHIHRASFCMYICIYVSVCVSVRIYFLSGDKKNFNMSKLLYDVMTPICPSCLPTEGDFRDMSQCKPMEMENIFLISRLSNNNVAAL